MLVNKIYYNNFGAIIVKNNGFIEYHSRNHRKSIGFNFISLVDSQYFSNDSELIVVTNKGIRVIDIKCGEFSDLKQMDAFEYCLYEYQSTFTTIHFKENGIYYEDIKFDGNLFESMNKIDFDVEKYRDKYYNTFKLKKFRIFNPLPEILNSNVKYYYLIGEYTSDEYSSIFVMNDNKVYGIGYNYCGVLGLGHNRRVNEYTLIIELCDQNIEEFFGGYDFMFGRNNKNQIFSWGNDRFGELARGFQRNHIF